jgi:hypothetical protein
MFNEIIIFQLLSLLLLLYFVASINIMSMWYIAGLYLLNLGFFLLLDDGGIFIGFLWVVDLGVGLIFFIFILHFSNFLYQKSKFNLFFKNFILFYFILFFFFIFFLFFSQPTDFSFNFELKKIWFFLISWYDYYDFFYSKTISDLNILREIYFYNNSLEFFLINFSILYGLFTAISLNFLIKKTFNFLISTQFKNFKLLTILNPATFIRNQNFIRQQNISAGTRVWIKNKKFSIKNDF